MSGLVCRCGHPLDSHIEEDDNSYCTGEFDGVCEVGCVCHQFAPINDEDEEGDIAYTYPPYSPPHPPSQ